MSEDSDQQFRPATQFSPASVDERVLADVKGNELLIGPFGNRATS
jgi:hypothetical protein